MSQTEGATPIRAVPPDDAPMSCLTMSPRAALAGVVVSGLVAVVAGMYVSAVIADPERSAAGAAPMVMVFLVALGTLTVAFLNLRWLLRNGVSFTARIPSNEPERSAPTPAATPTRAPASPTFSPVRRTSGEAGTRPAPAPAPAPTPPVTSFPAPPAPPAPPQPAPAIPMTPAAAPVVDAPLGDAPDEPLPSLPVIDPRPVTEPVVVVPTRTSVEHRAPEPQPEPETEPETEPEPEPEAAEVAPEAAPSGARRVLRPQRVGRGTDRSTGPKGAKGTEAKSAPKRVAGRPRT